MLHPCQMQFTESESSTGRLAANGFVQNVGTRKTARICTDRRGDGVKGSGEAVMKKRASSSTPAHSYQCCFKGYRNFIPANIAPIESATRSTSACGVVQLLQRTLNSKRRLSAVVT